MELSSSSIMKTFLIFQETETPKNFFYISGKGTLLYFRKQKVQKTSYISGSNFPSLKNDKKPLLNCFLYFGKCNVLAIRNFSCFRNLRSLKIKNFLYFSL